MEQLSVHDEQLIENFHFALGHVATVEDMFPPEDDASLVPARPYQPRLSGGAVCALEFQFA